MVLTSLMFFFILTVTFGNCVTISLTREELVNVEVHRSIDISTQLVTIEYNITLQNNGQGMVKHFEFFVEPDIRHSLAYIEAYSVELEPFIKKKLAITELKEDEYTDPVSWNINLQKPMKIGLLFMFEIIAVFIQQLRPYPTYIVQDDNQLVKYSGNYYFYSPYLTKKQTTLITCGNDKFESYSTMEPTLKFQNFISYGPYENVPPFSFQKQSVHYENNEPFLTVTNMERVIEVSHWGNIAVKETIELIHKGAVLKGPFSRFDYQERLKMFPNRRPSISGFTTVLPASAKDIYYKDLIGNVSSSQVNVLPDSVEMKIQLRFPLFGGWKICYTIGYNIPSYEYLYNFREDFVLRMRVLDHIYDNFIVEELTTKIILPEHSTEIWMFTPYPMVRLPDNKHYSYLDTVGRPVITIAKGKMVDYHIQEFELHYEFPKEKILLEPFLIITVFYLLLLLVIIIVRVDFSITSDTDVDTNTDVGNNSALEEKKLRHKKSSLSKSKPNRSW